MVRAADAGALVKRAVLAVLAVVGLAACGERIEVVEVVESTTASTTTQAPATTQAPTTQPRPSMEEIVHDLWETSGYCFTDCSRIGNPGTWMQRAEQFGPVDPDDFIYSYETFADTSTYELDDICTAFWELSDDEVADAAWSYGFDPSAMILNFYVWCDS